MDKDKPKPTTGEKLVEDLNKRKKEIKKENKEMKNNSTVKTIITVAITLVAVAAFATTFYFGTQLGASIEKSKTADIHAEAKSLASSVTSKQ